MSWRCQQPEVLRQLRGNSMVIPCGHCLGCEAKWRKGWVLRMMLEAQSTGHARFLTLTYQTGAGRSSLDYSDVASFLKRLRKNTRLNVRFFCAGEYGETLGRPHWHLILFGVPSSVMTDGLCSLREWPFGGVMVASAPPAAMAYVAGYSLKKRLEEVRIVMSRRPGIGLEQCGLLGEEMAAQLPEIERFPSVVRMGRHLYPLHQRARDVMQSAFLAAGGTIQRPARMGVSLELEASLVLRSGQWSAQTLSVEKAFDREWVKRLEKKHGTAQKAA